MNHRICLYDHAQLAPVLARMADQAATLLRGTRSLALVGMLRRGEPLARMLQKPLASDLGLSELAVYGLSLKRYSDDLQLLHPQTLLTENPQLAALDLASTTLLLVDDVLYQGHSLLRALNYLHSLGAQRLVSAVLVDRCVAKLPVRADVVGLRLQVSEDFVIECQVPPYEPNFCITLFRPPKSA